MKFSQPTMLVVQSTDGKDLEGSQAVQMYVAFGDRPARWDGKAVHLKL